MSIKKQILANLNAKVLTKKDTGGHRDLAELCSDIVNAATGNDITIAAKTDLSPTTVKRVRECIKPYNPASRTIEKILLAYDFTLEAK